MRLFFLLKSFIFQGGKVKEALEGLLALEKQTRMVRFQYCFDLSIVKYGG